MRNGKKSGKFGKLTNYNHYSISENSKSFKTRSLLFMTNFGLIASKGFKIGSTLKIRKMLKIIKKNERKSNPSVC